MEPYWLVNTQVNFPALKQDMHVDVAVIGAGITGASVCYWLGGKCKVVLLEKDAIASKASGRNAGFLLTGTSDHYNKAIAHYGHDKAKAIWKITQQNHDLLEKHVFNAIECDHKRSGSYHVATSEREMEDLLESAAMLRKDGFNCTIVNERETNDLLSSKGFYGAAFNVRDGEVNPVKLVEALVGRAKENGTQIFEKTAVKRIARNRNGFSIKTRHATINSHFVVLATNAYTPMLYPYFKSKITAVRGQMLATNPLGKRFRGVFYANYGYEYWRQTPDGRILAGGFREADFERERGYRMVTTKNIQNRLEKLLIQLSLKFNIEHRWSGIMGFSKDHLPLIGPLPNAKNLLVSAGYSGHGLGFSFVAGRMISEIIVGGKTKNLELFSPSRLC